MTDVEIEFSDKSRPPPPSPQSSADARKTAERLYAHEKKESSLSRAMDMIRQLVLVGTVVLIILLVIGSLSNHPAIDVKHKYFALGGLITVCGGYAISLWLVRGQPVILLLLVIMGTGTLMFALGWTVSEMRRGFT